MKFSNSMQIQKESHQIPSISAHCQTLSSCPEAQNKAKSAAHWHSRVKSFRNSQSIVENGNSRLFCLASACQSPMWHCSVHFYDRFLALVDHVCDAPFPVVSSCFLSLLLIYFPFFTFSQFLLLFFSFFLVASCLFAHVSIWLVVVWIFATFSRLWTRLFVPSDSLFEPGKSKPKLAAFKETIRILTLNTFLRPMGVSDDCRTGPFCSCLVFCCFFWLLTSCLHSGDWKSERVAEIIDHMSNFDIICFQECFSVNSFQVKKLVGAAAVLGFHYWVCPPHLPWFRWMRKIGDNGILIVSRLRPSSQLTIVSSIAAHMLTDCLSKASPYCKVQFAPLPAVSSSSSSSSSHTPAPASRPAQSFGTFQQQPPAPPYFHLFVTHFQADYGIEHEDVLANQIKLSQLADMDTFMLSKTKNDDFPVVIAADFNIPFEDSTDCNCAALADPDPSYHHPSLPLMKDFTPSTPSRGLFFFWNFCFFLLYLSLLSCSYVIFLCLGSPVPSVSHSASTASMSSLADNLSDPPTLCSSLYSQMMEQMNPYRFRCSRRLQDLLMQDVTMHHHEKERRTSLSSGSSNPNSRSATVLPLFSFRDWDWGNISENAILLYSIAFFLTSPLFSSLFLLRVVRWLVPSQVTPHIHLMASFLILWSPAPPLKWPDLDLFALASVWIIFSSILAQILFFRHVLFLLYQPAPLELRIERESLVLLLLFLLLRAHLPVLAFLAAMVLLGLCWLLSARRSKSLLWQIGPFRMWVIILEFQPNSESSSVFNSRI